jgi:acyl-CoA reductase-like NAD-dependent aldehyde dehydrogenase
MTLPGLTDLDRGERMECLHGLAGAIASTRQDLIGGMVQSTKKAWQVATGEVDLALRRLGAFDQVDRLLADRRAVGTVAIVFPGNAALSNPVATLGTAFLAGNRVLARFPRASRAWADRIEPLFASHLPGVSFDHGTGPDFIRRVFADPEVAVVLVFGDDAWMDQYAELIRASRKKLIFEGPGKDPFLVLPGADLDRAARDAVRGSCYNAGQACTSPERFYVHRDLAPKFIDFVVELTRREVMGEPDREDTTVGPIASRRVSDRIAVQLRDAVDRGAEILAGGGLHGAVLADGSAVTYVEPTVVAAASPDMLLMREETFGPVIPIQEVADADEAVALAGASPYGLAACVYGGNGTEAAALAASHGQVFKEEIWLDYFARNLHAPYGGRKRSGWVWEWEGDRFVHRDGARCNAIELSRQPAD